MKVTAVRSSGEQDYKETQIQRNNLKPTWNKMLFFSDGEWQFFRIRVWDNDSGRSSDDEISTSETVPLLNLGRFSNGRTHCANTKCDHFVKYDYKVLTPVCCNLQVNMHNLTDGDGSLTVREPYVVVTDVRPDGINYTTMTQIKSTLCGTS